MMSDDVPSAPLRLSRPRETAAQSLVRRNQAVFRKHFPAVFSALSQLGQIESMPVLDDQGIVDNIRVDQATIYPGPAREWTAGQIRGFLADPPRIAFQDVGHCNVTDLSLQYLQDLRETPKAINVKHCASAQVVDSGYCFVFGVGLGHHIEPLLQNLKIHHLVLIEPAYEFLLHSMAVVDWGKLVRLAARKGIRIHFVTHPTPKEAERALETILVSMGSSFIDGSYFYYHYYSWVLVETNSLFSIGVRHHFVSTGFFEDECRMMRNAAQHAFSVCENRPMLQRDDVPVFVVASGPSLDQDVEVIRRWRDKVVLISCGTTLSILLRHGIRPDIHIEIENGFRTPEQLKRTADTHGLQGIILCASLTVSPDVVAMFDEAWLFFRSALSPAVILRGSHAVLLSSDPTVANGGTAAAASSGFREIYLFGVDCGMRDGTAHHHAKDSIYYRDKDFHLGDLDSTFNKVLPGNFGGTFRANYVLDMSARVIAETQRQYRHAMIYNCSDGVRIEGVRPKASAAIDLSHVTASPRDVIGKIRDQMIHYTPGGLGQTVDVEALIDGTTLYVDQLTAFFAQAHDKYTSFWDLREDLVALIASMPRTTRGFRSMAESSIMTMLRATSFYGNRLSSPAKRKALANACVALLPKYLQMMHDEAIEIFRGIRGQDSPSHS